MEKDVIITVKARQKVVGGGKDTIELVTHGKLTCQDGAAVLVYQESELAGMEGTLTTILQEGERVTMLRTGQINTQMVFQDGRRHLGMYDTPYGAMSVGIHTMHMNADLGENGGSLEIDYSIEIDHVLTGRNLFQLTAKPLPVPQ